MDAFIELIKIIDEEFALRHFLLFFFVFGVFEYLIPLNREQKFFRPGMMTDLIHMLFSGKALGFVVAFIFPVVVGVLSFVVPNSINEFIERLPWWMQVGIIFIVTDFGVYVMHRLMHSIPILWSFHAIHHSSRELDWMSTYRFHPIDQIMIRGISLLPVFILNFSTTAILAALVIYEWHSIILHSNLKINFGPLRHILVTPAVHRLHHADQPEIYNKNFSSQLVIWDKIFGTYYFQDEPSLKYGVSDPIPGSYIQQIIYPIQKLFSSYMIRRDGSN